MKQVQAARTKLEPPPAINGTQGSRCGVFQTSMWSKIGHTQYTSRILGQNVFWR